MVVITVRAARRTAPLRAVIPIVGPAGGSIGPTGPSGCSTIRLITLVRLGTFRVVFRVVSLVAFRTASRLVVPRVVVPRVVVQVCMLRPQVLGSVELTMMTVV